jgi:hypothetical protein
MEQITNEETKRIACRNCLYLVRPQNYPAALHRVFNCSIQRWNDVVRGINPSNPNGVRSPNLDYSCNEFTLDIRNHSIPDKEKIDTENQSRSIQRDEWESSKHSNDHTKRRRRRTRRKHSIEHLCGEPSFAQENTSDDDSGEPSFAQENTSDDDSGDSSQRGLEALESLLPSGSVCLGVFKEETWNATVWRTEIHFYLVKSEDPNFLWDLCGIHWDDNWSKYNWELYSRITNIKDPYMAGFLLVENFWDSSYKNTRTNPYRDFLASILNDS